ncbi:hypothetical protein BC830DRAFT_1176027, partial [Chytriomyces sp. MP71]
LCDSLNASRTQSTSLTSTTSLATSASTSTPGLEGAIANAIQGLNFAGLSPAVQSIYSAGLAMLQQSPQNGYDAAVAAAKVGQNLLCGNARCDDTIQKGASAVELACGAILSNGSSIAPGMVNSLLSLGGFQTMRTGVASDVAPPTQRVEMGGNMNGDGGGGALPAMASGCHSGNAAPANNLFQAHVSKLRGSIKEVSAADLSASLAQGPKNTFHLFDVR